jgi:hypothetical protein
MAEKTIAALFFDLANAAAVRRIETAGLPQTEIRTRAAGSARR